ncbi:MAG: enoyl-CoA hydratase-related protein [Sorangiineae bacterium]|nr:enoyl-CoA hydratase-related protein [Polyangiaceae bacterium]MEB2322695.1 enoyl-CoA hydratase-related protein [Sorangiineae bacterium]
MTTYETLLVTKDGPLATITINRPDKLNALSSKVIAELTHAFRSLGEGEPATRAAILTGAGDKAFVAGADIAEMSELAPAVAKAFSDAGHRLGREMEEAPFPIIAAVNGFALGGGCELALAADFIYASDRARFGQPEVNLGLMPGFGGTQRLARRVGLGHARELVYSAEMIDAERALTIGLVNRVVPHAELMSVVRSVASAIASKAPLAVAASKRVMARGYDAELGAACELEATAFGALFGSEDEREGTRAFIEKRKPEFKGR